MKFIEDEEIEEILQINPKAELEEVVYDNTKFKVIRNFLKYPEEYKNLLSYFPAVRDHTYSPGFRQDVPPWAARFITTYIQKNVSNWIPARVSCNIYNGNMRMRTNANLPHSDNFYGIWNLWFNKNCLGGTAFWSHKGKLHVDDLSEEEYMHLFDKTLSATGYQEWRNFRGDDDWELSCIAPMEYNTLLFYNGGFFHSPWVLENWYIDEDRYSMIGMGDYND
jgi:hypothetical protein